MKSQSLLLLLLLLLLWPLLNSCASFSLPKGCAYPGDTSYADGGFSVEVRVFTAADGKASAKSLLIMPPTGGMNYIDQKYAKQFCAAGYDVTILKEWSGMHEESTDLELHERLYGGAQRAISLVLDRSKSPFTGLLGTSVGALHGAVAASYQDRLNAIFIITGGAPITEIIVNSDQKAMQELKKARYARYGFKNDAEYLAALNKAFTLDPFELPPKFKNKILGMSIATEDTTVPTAFQTRLQELWHPRLSLSRPSSHFWGIVKTWYADDGEILKFFEEAARGKTAAAPR